MKPEMEAKVKYGTWGVIGGATVAMVIGFVWGGWTTSSTTQKMSEEAVQTARAAICVAQFKKDPDYEVRLKEFGGMDTYKRSDYVQTGGWDKPNRNPTFRRLATIVAVTVTVGFIAVPLAFFVELIG